MDPNERANGLHRPSPTTGEVNRRYVTKNLPLTRSENFFALGSLSVKRIKNSARLEVGQTDRDGEALTVRN